MSSSKSSEKTSEKVVKSESKQDRIENANANKDKGADLPTKKRKIEKSEEDTKTSKNEEDVDYDDLDDIIPAQQGPRKAKEESKVEVKPEKKQESKIKKEADIEETATTKEEDTDEVADIKYPVIKGSKFVTIDFHPIRDAIWKKGEKVPYLALAKAFEEIEKVSSRLKITEILSNLFRSIIALSPDDLLACLYLSINKLAAEHEGTELGIGESILMKALAEATARTVQSVKASYDEMGDLGLVAKASRTNQRTMSTPAQLTIQSVFKKLKEVAQLQGNASQNKKKDLIKGLLVACRDCEATYIIRSLQGKLRIGLAEKSVLGALAHAFVLTPSPDRTIPSGTKLDDLMNKGNEILCSVFSELPIYDRIIPVLLKEGIDKLSDKCHLTPGIPIKPMLAQPTKNGISEVLDRFADMTFTCEFKYDGERGQIHFMEDGSVKIYSRNLENNTEKYPDIIDFLPNAMKPGVTSFILDCEIVAYDRESSKILSFQKLTTRARKNVKIEDIKVQICLYAFDILFLNGKSLLKDPLIERRRKLVESFNEMTGRFTFAKHKDISDTDEIQSFLQEAVEGNCEGLMVKTLEKEANYEPSKRSYNWLKIKKDYIDGMGDSLDLVVIGAYLGRGKRTGVYGGYLLACYDDETEQFQSICKIGTGLSDDDLSTQMTFFKSHIIAAPKSYYIFGDNVKADVWFEPVQVWEILAADLSLSPVHKAAIGMVDASRGIALRIRDDKKPEDATTATQVSEMYRNQKINHGNKENAGADEDNDFY